MSATISTTCAHCRREIVIEINSELKYRVDTAETQPMVFMPHVNWETFSDPNIIHAY